MKQGNLVESILISQSLYLQPGCLGDRLINTLDNIRIIIEVPDMGFRNVWDPIFLAAVEAYFRKKGLNKKASHEAAINGIHEMRKLISFRMRN
jgi:hypothetical protein